MYALRLDIHLDEPLLVTGVINGEENSSTSLNYIPGSALRGACVAAYLQRNRKIKDLAAPGLARRLFFENEVFFLNGYLAHPSATKQPERALPRPLSWHMEKDDRENDDRQVWDFAIETAKLEKPKREKRAFFWQVEEIDEPYPLSNLRRQFTVHNASQNPMSKEENTSDVFRYDSLASKQCFVAYVLSESKELLEEVEKYFPDGQYHLGGSQTAGYGLVTMLATKMPSWQSEAEVDEEVENVTIVTLLSNTILRTADGQPTTDFHETLKTKLGKPQNWQPKAIFAQTQLVGGFNRKWGLPLPQRWAVAMGSTFVYKSSDLTPDELGNLLATGIGERRNEGFGRLAVNLNSQPNFRTHKPQMHIPEAQTLTANSQKLARDMARRRLLAEVRTKVPDYVSEIKFQERPENTQLSRLRVLVRQAQRKKDLSLITYHLDNLRKAKEQFTRRRLETKGGPVTWDHWLRTRVNNQDGLSQLKVDSDNPQFKLAGEVPNVDDELHLEVTCTLIEAVLRQAIRRE